MRVLKFFSIALTALCIFLAITYGARVLIVNHLAKAQLNLAQMTITCLDLKLASNMTIIVDKLCLQSPKAEIELFDMAIQWRYAPKIKITNIDVRLAKVKGTEHLFSNTSFIPPNQTSQDNEQNLSQWLSTTLQTYAEKISHFQLPTKITISEISYLPFTMINKASTAKNIIQQDNSPYSASLSALDNALSFSLQNGEKAEVIKARLTKKHQDFAIALSTNLTLVKNFVSKHQLPITTALQKAFNASKFSGKLDSIIEYQPNSLSMHNKLTDMLIDVDEGIGRSGSFKLLGTLNFHAQFNLMTKSGISEQSQSEIALTFTEKNELAVVYEQDLLVKILEEKDIAAELLALLQDNLFNQLTLNTQDNTTLTLNEKNLYLSNITINARGDERIHHLNLNNIALTLPEYSKTPSKETRPAVVVEAFMIDSQLKLASIEKFTSKPVTFHLAGSLKNNEKQTEINLTESTLITANNITVLKESNNATTTEKTLSLKNLTAKLSGSVQLSANNALSMNVKVHSQGSQLDMPKTVQINSFDLVSQINGNIDDMQINATAQADGIALGRIVITGPLFAPNVQITAKQLQLTNLLTLKIQLPTTVELIDGLVDYSISSQLTDLSHLENTPVDVSITVTSVSGKVDDIWLEELNWHQDFTLLNGKITTKPTTSENLTVALIETPAPISKLSLNTNWTFNKNFKLSASKLKADALGGRFAIPQFQWPFEHGHSVNVQLDSIDLAQVLALDKKQGIVVTGNISGEIPVTFDGEKYTIEHGELHNITNGLIQVINNPAVAELKANNSELQLAFDALQNLHYHQLSSAVSMSDDGYMLLDTVIKGRNPDIDSDINLNLNLSYDLLGLLESLSITQHFEENIIKGLQKK